MTRPSVVSDLLICAPSFRRAPVASVDLARSEPARSTRRIRAVRSMVSSESSEWVICLRRIVKTAWDRDDVSFILVEATVRLFTRS